MYGVSVCVCVCLMGKNCILEITEKENDSISDKLIDSLLIS